MSVIVMDGGMGGEIAKRYEDAKQGLWSASVLTEMPEMVIEIHREYIAAGARMIITNTYSTIPSYLAKAGREAEYIDLTRLGGELARKAVNDSGEVVQVAGSLPPLSESYRPDLVPPAAESLPVYENLVEALLPNVDLFICETMSSADEALHAASTAVAHGQGKPVYISWTLAEEPGGGLRSGETVTEAYNRVAHLDVAGFMFNCTMPEAIEAALRELRQLTDKPLGCYPNRTAEVPEGWTLDNELSAKRRTDLTTDYFVTTCFHCIDEGASIVGGCCGIGPEDIAALAEALEARQA